jgi:hypothetical protein
MSIPTLNLKELTKDSPDRTFKRSAAISPLKKKKSARKTTNESESDNEKQLALGSSCDSVPEETSSPTKFERKNNKHMTIALGSTAAPGDRSARLRALGIKPMLTHEQQKEIAKLKASARGPKMIVKAAPETSKGYGEGRTGASDQEEIQNDSQDDLEDFERSDDADDDDHQETLLTQGNDSARNYESLGAQTGSNGELKLTRLSTDLLGTPILKPTAGRGVTQMLPPGSVNQADPLPTNEDEPGVAGQPNPQPSSKILRAPSFKEYGRTKSKVNQTGVRGTTSVYISLFRKDSSFSVFWNTVIMVCNLLDLIIIPLELCSQDVEYIGWFSFITLTVIQACYLADIYINFNRTYYDHQVREVVDPSKIRIRYFESYDFMLDLFSCSPILAYRKIFCSSKGYNQLFLLIRIIKSLKIKTILIEFHQRFYVSSKLYFLGYLISVLTIVELVVTIVASGDLHLAFCGHQQVHVAQGPASNVPSLLRRRNGWMSRRADSKGDDVAATNVSQHRAPGSSEAVLRRISSAQIRLHLLQLRVDIIWQRDRSSHQF